MRTKIFSIILSIVLTVIVDTSVDAATKIKVQMVMGENSPEYVMLTRFAADVSALTGGEVKLEILPKIKTTETKGLLEKIHKGKIGGGFAWTHYWSSYHPATMLFGSPTAGGGLGYDNISWVAWYLYGGGRELYKELWSEMGMNIKGIMLQPQGPEALGWFQEPIKNMDDFRDYTYRAPPGIPGQAYLDLGVDAVTMGGSEILPALKNGTIDAAEWCCPLPDRTFGFQKVLKNYYLQGVHQNVVNSDLYINGDLWKKISPEHQKAIEIAADASLIHTIAWRMHENGKALKDLTDNHGVILHDTPADYFTEYSEAAKNLFSKFNTSSPFFKKVYDSMEKFAQSTVPFWAQAQSSNAQIGSAYAKGSMNEQNFSENMIETDEYESPQSHENFKRDMSQGLTIEEAKEGLAKKFSVDVHAVEITIRG